MAYHKMSHFSLYSLSYLQIGTSTLMQMNVPKNQSEYATCGALKVAFIVVIANKSQQNPGCNKVGFEEQVLISIMTGHAPICSAHHICNMENARNQQQVAIVLLKDPSKTIRTQSLKFSRAESLQLLTSLQFFPELFKSTESTSTPLIFSYQ